jgi:hypothetical protein
MNKDAYSVGGPVVQTSTNENNNQNIENFKIAVSPPPASI